MLENRRKRYFERCQVYKITCTIFVRVEHHQSAPTEPYMDREGELRNEEKSWNRKLIERLLLTITVAEPERFTFKGKLVIYTRAFVGFYNWKNCG